MHLTNRLDRGNNPPVAAKEAAGAPVTITDEMTNAGIAALQEFNLSEDRLDWIVGSVYEAMEKERIKSLALSVFFRSV